MTSPRDLIAPAEVAAHAACQPPGPAAAVASVLATRVGNDISFTTSSLGLHGVTRSFDSFTEAANEAGQSRIYGGIHFQSANQHGLGSGRALGDYVVANFLRPI